MRIIRKPEKNISKEMIGLFFEDINYAGSVFFSRTSIMLQTEACMRR